MDTTSAVISELERHVQWARRATALTAIRDTDRTAYVHGVRTLVDEGCPQVLLARVLGVSRSTLNYQVLHAVAA